MNLANIPDKPFTLPELYQHWGVEPKKQSVPFSSQVRRDLVRHGYVMKRRNGRDEWEKRT